MTPRYIDALRAQGLYAAYVLDGFADDLEPPDSLSDRVRTAKGPNTTRCRNRRGGRRLLRPRLRPPIPAGVGSAEHLDHSARNGGKPSESRDREPLSLDTARISNWDGSRSHLEQASGLSRRGLRAQPQGYPPPQSSHHLRSSWAGDCSDGGQYQRREGCRACHAVLCRLRLIEVVSLLKPGTGRKAGAARTHSKSATGGREWKQSRGNRPLTTKPG